MVNLKLLKTFVVGLGLSERKGSFVSISLLREYRYSPPCASLGEVMFFDQRKIEEKNLGPYLFSTDEMKK